MTSPQPHEALTRIKTQLRLTHLGLWAERLTRAFWPLWTLALTALALLSFNPFDLLPLEAGWFALIATLAALLAALVHGLRAFHRPTRTEALIRLDATLPGRPLAALTDTQAIGAADPASQTVWAAHRARMAARAATARTAPPDLRLASRDLYGLRYMALTLLVTALLFGSLWRATTLPALPSAAAAATGPAWEGWAAPPAYTGKPTLYLSDLTDPALTLPTGTKLSLRLYGDPGALILTETISGRTAPPPASEQAQEFTLTQSGRLAIEGTGGRDWQITALPDTPPTIEATGLMTREADGRFKQNFTATDDYGVQKGDVTITLNLQAVDRRHGLALPPDTLTPVTLDLPLPMKRDRRDVTATLVDDLSKDILANLPATLTFSATDAAGQTTPSAPLETTLPGRRFFDPLAAALIEMRRDLLWTRANAPRASMILKAVSYKPEGFFRNQNAYLRLRVLIASLDRQKANLAPETRDEIAEELWQIALMVEEGDLASALERLRRAQDRVDEAIRNGASPEEIEDLMREMQEALNDYMRREAEQNGPPGQDEPQTSENGQQGMQMTQDQLNQMLQKLEELMKEGRTAEAQELMDELRRFMENMRVTQGEGGQGQGSPGDQAMRGLGETLRDQQQLSDDSFQGLQNGPEGQEPGAEGQGLADRQRDLQQRLDQLREGGDLPGAGDPKGQEGRRQLDRAGRAMEDAEEALRNGDLPQALDRQAEAMEALRDGVRNLGEAQAQNQEDGTQQGQATAREAPEGQRDPLGRETGQSSQMGTDRSMLQDTDVYRRAQDLLDEIRRRAGEQNRPDVERGYLKRLLDLF